MICNRDCNGYNIRFLHAIAIATAQSPYISSNNHHWTFLFYLIYQSYTRPDTIATSFFSWIIFEIPALFLLHIRRIIPGQNRDFVLLLLSSPITVNIQNQLCCGTKIIIITEGSSFFQYLLQFKLHTFRRRSPEDISIPLLVYSLPQYLQKPLVCFAMLRHPPLFFLYFL